MSCFVDLTLSHTKMKVFSDYMWKVNVCAKSLCNIIEPYIDKVTHKVWREPNPTNPDPFSVNERVCTNTTSVHQIIAVD